VRAALSSTVSRLVETSPTREATTAHVRKAKYLANVWFAVALAPGLLVFSFPKLFGRELIPNLSGTSKLWVAFVLIAWALGIGFGPYRRALKRAPA
jgi:hypothetical protein